MCCAQLPAELDNHAYLTSDIAHRSMFIALGMVEHEAAASEMKRNFPPIFNLIKKLKDAKDDRAPLFDKLEQKFDNLGVMITDVND